MMQSSVQEVKISLEGAKKLQALGQALARLEKNKDFQAVINVAYCENETFRLTGMLAECTEDKNCPPSLGGISKALIVSQLTSIAHLSAWLRTTRDKVSGIDEQVQAYEQEAEYLRQEVEGV